jgi:hypothetical protein
MSDLHNPEHPENPDNPEVVHEDSDVNVRAIFGFGIGLAVVALIVHVFLWWLQGTYERQNERTQTWLYPLAAGQQNQLPPSPRLQHDPQLDMRELRARQQALLEGYGWVNRDGGVARIPITEAMRMVVERGLPTREAGK